MTKARTVILHLQTESEFNARLANGTFSALGADRVTAPGSTNVFTVEISVTADSAREAMEVVLQRCAHIPELDVLTASTAPTEQPLHGKPEYLGVAELAEFLRVSRQRASALARDPHFPAPTAVLRSGPIWHRSLVLPFAASIWRRRPGRPSVGELRIREAQHRGNASRGTAGPPEQRIQETYCLPL